MRFTHIIKFTISPEREHYLRLAHEAEAIKNGSNVHRLNTRLGTLLLMVEAQERLKKNPPPYPDYPEDIDRLLLVAKMELIKAIRDEQRKLFGGTPRVRSSFLKE